MMADRSWKEYPQWGQQRRLQFFASRQPEHFTSFSENCFPHSGHLYDFSSVISESPGHVEFLAPDGERQTLNVKFLISDFA
jgi:hypothetical protein